MDEKVYNVALVYNIEYVKWKCNSYVIQCNSHICLCMSKHECMCVDYIHIHVHIYIHVFKECRLGS